MQKTEGETGGGFVMYLYENKYFIWVMRHFPQGGWLEGPAEAYQNMRFCAICWPGWRDEMAGRQCGRRGDFSPAEEVGGVANPMEESFVRAEALEPDVGRGGVAGVSRRLEQETGPWRAGACKRCLLIQRNGARESALRRRFGAHTRGKGCARSFSRVGYFSENFRAVVKQRNSIRVAVGSLVRSK